MSLPVVGSAERSITAEYYVTVGHAVKYSTVRIMARLISEVYAKVCVLSFLLRHPLDLHLWSRDTLVPKSVRAPEC
jgi:hypothetical protein